MDNLLKKAGAMTAHLDLFQHMLHLRGLLQLAAHMEERGDRVTMVSADNITLIGSGMDSAATVTTSKGAEITSASAYGVLQSLKSHDAAEYAVTREELKALNARAVTELEASEAMRAFGETLSRITALSASSHTVSGTASAAAQPANAAAPEVLTPELHTSPTSPDRPNRGRRGNEETSGDTPTA